MGSMTVGALTLRDREFGDALEASVPFILYRDNNIYLNRLQPWHGQVDHTFDMRVLKCNGNKNQFEAYLIANNGVPVSVTIDDITYNAIIIVNDCAEDKNYWVYNLTFTELQVNE